MVCMMPDVQEEILEGGLSCMSFGDGPPLVVFPGLGLSNASPVGFQRWGEVRLLASLTRVRTVYRVGRRIGLGTRTTMAELANDYARAIEGEFGRAVDVLGISTGGSVALQLAADRPWLLRKLVVAGAAYRLGRAGREFQRHIAEFAAAGSHRAPESLPYRKLALVSSRQLARTPLITRSADGRSVAR
jgi:pimeloyl-ACP methyl ester carboxylesterase